MIFSIKEHVDGIVEASSRRERVEHMWLHGFHSIMDKVWLDKLKAESYLEVESSKSPPFTKLRSSAQAYRICAAFMAGINLEREPIPPGEIKTGNRYQPVPEEIRNILHAWLPINDFYHLEFPLFSKRESLTFIYSLCDKCKGIEEHGFPEINLRRSVNLSGTMKEREVLMYDNSVSPMHQDRGTIEESYSSLQKLVEGARIK
ncbi:MAG TPA: hypothetical protein HA218_04605 [Nanoarchaeota archaeon]|nr:hypothetical protein [Nanoarchaeota archaeon]